MPGGPLTLFLVTKTEIQEEFRGDIEIRLDKTKSTLQISYRCLDPFWWNKISNCVLWMENLERIQVWPDLEKQLPDGRLWRHMAPNVDDHSNQDLIFISNKERRIKIWYLSQTQNKSKVVETVRESLYRESNSGAVNCQKWCSAENNKLPTNIEWDVDCSLLLSLHYSK